MFIVGSGAKKRGGGGIWDMGYGIWEMGGERGVSGSLF